MKFFKWKIFLITSAVCLLPILLGLYMWESLPQQIAIHFDINNNPDNFSSKAFAVFGFPIIMILFQGICCFAADISTKNHHIHRKIEHVTKWIIPLMTLILQPTMLFYATGVNLDIRRIACFIVGTMLIVTGNYLPKLDFIKNYNIDSEKARKINRFMGYETVILGVLMLISLFLPPIASVVCLFLLIPFTVISLVYAIVAIRRK